MRGNFAKNVAVIAGLVALGVVTRWLPGVLSEGLFNANAIGAIALFSGFYFRDWKLAVIAPLLSMAIADLQLEEYSVWMKLINYAAVLLAVAFGPYLRSRTATRLLPSVVTSSVLFFLVSNFGHWLVMRPNTLIELQQSYIDAIPFFRPTLIGNAVFSVAIFGAYALAMQVERAKPQVDAVRV